MGHFDRRMEYGHDDFANLLAVRHIEKQNHRERERQRERERERLNCIYYNKDILGKLILNAFIWPS